MLLVGVPATLRYPMTRQHQALSFPSVLVLWLVQKRLLDLSMPLHRMTGFAWGPAHALLLFWLLLGR